MKYLFLEEILRLHFQVVKDFGGSHGIRNEQRLKSVVEAPKMIAFGEEQYKTVYEKAAVYMRNIISDHAFIDGNKRTAVTVAAIFLARNGVKLTAVPKDLEDFAVYVVTNKPHIEEIAVWLQKHTN